MNYEWSSHDYAKEYFDRMVKEKKHLPFRKWLIEQGLIGKGMRITTYKPEYMIEYFKAFNRR